MGSPLPLLPNFPPKAPFTIGPTGIITFNQTPVLPGVTGPIVSGPVSSTDSTLAQWSGTSGALLKDGLPVGAAGGVQPYSGGTITLGAGASLTITAAKAVSFLNSLTLAGTDGKTLTVSNSLTLAGTDATTQTFPNASGAVTSNAQQVTNLLHSNPANTSSAAMMGLGDTWRITPATSNRVLVIVTGTFSNNTAADGTQVVLKYGTVAGGVPANGAASTGTSMANNQPITGTNSGATGAGNQNLPLCIIGLMTGLTPGTAYWIDCLLAIVTGGTSTLQSLNILALEL